MDDGNDREDYQRLILNLELVGERFEKNIKAFNELSEEEQEEISRVGHTIRQAISARLMDDERRELRAAFRDALMSAQSSLNSQSAEEEADLFVRSLDDIAEYAFEMHARQSEEQERRRDKVESMVKAATRLAGVMKSLDDASLGHLLASAVDEIGAGLGEEWIAERGLPGNSVAWMFLADELKCEVDRLAPLLVAGLTRGAETLPRISLDSKRPEFMVAAWLEDWFGRSRIPFSTTDTGLAGRAFHAVMQMAGVEKEKAGYWLAKARDSDQSWSNFLARRSGE